MPRSTQQLHPFREPVATRPAATVLLLRDATAAGGAGGIEVLTTRRSDKASFAPGAYVFPGGGIDALDAAPDTHAAADRRPSQSDLHLTQAIAAIRESFEELGILLARHAGSAQAACLLLVDIDLFKAINDRQGHAVGDDVLRGIAGVIRDALPEGSHAGRLGGDEFAIAVPVALDEARRIAERIRGGVDALAFACLPALRCSVSIGIAESPTSDADLRAWMEAADHALYRAKAGGRNCVSVRLDAPDSMLADS